MKPYTIKFNRLCYLPIVIMGLLLTLSSCKKWLDVSPKTEIKEEEQFSSEQGFIDALFGIYQKAADPSVYGAEMTYGLLDVFAQRYEGKTALSETYGRTARYDYVDGPTRAKLIGIWNNSYAAIAQCNYILANVDKRKAVLSAQSYAIVKGEALGMRAFLHFDLLRMFALAYQDGTNATAAAIPYMSGYQVKPQPRQSVAAIFDKCEVDLKEAEELLSVYTDIDQIARNQGSTNSDLFLMYRQNHMNFWAVKAALARLYLYKGDKVQALSYAKAVIGSGKFNLMSPTIINNKPEELTSDMSFSPEHIFSVYIKALKTNSDIYFKTVQANVGDAGDYFSTEPRLDEVYEYGQIGYASDVRSHRSVLAPMWTRISAQTLYTMKYYVGTLGNNVRQSRIPVIRLPEMYYIAAETDPDAVAGLEYLNQIRQARLLPKLPAGLTAAQFDNEIFKEYRKEFYGEGQLWFYYKRKNWVNIPHSPAGVQMTASKYVFPLPDSEIEFGN